MESAGNTLKDQLKKDIFKYIDKLIVHGNSDNSDFDVNIHLEDDLKNEIKFLFQKYQHYNNYSIYKKWFENYNNLSDNITILQNENINLEKHIEYFELIKPRIYNYYKIKKDYDLLIIYKSYLYCKYDKTISIYNNYYQTLNKKIIKDNYLNKIKIDKLDNEIITINSYISKLETEKTINDNNKNILNNLKEIEENLNNIIDIITIIIDKFKDYKKWLYDNYILKNIITNTNNFIKLLIYI